MKKLLFITCFSLFTNLFLNAQTNLIETTGNVGIGTITPSAKLEVSGSANNASVVLSNENFIGFKRVDGKLVYGIGHTAGEFTIGRTANLGPTAGTPINIASGSIV